MTQNKEKLFINSIRKRIFKITESNEVLIDRH